MKKEASDAPIIDADRIEIRKCDTCISKKHKNLMKEEASDACGDTNDGHHQPALPSKLVRLFSKPGGVNLQIGKSYFVQFLLFPLD